MRPILAVSITAFALAILLSGLPGSPILASTGPIPLNCNRACLENVVDQYLTALVARDPKRVPLSADVNYAKDNQVIPVGDGFWKTVGGSGMYTNIFSDPEYGQVAYMGTMMDDIGPLL